MGNRENWGTRAGFVLAAIGSAVGLGNLGDFRGLLMKMAAAHFFFLI